jgi:hypothetical protein
LALLAGPPLCGPAPATGPHHGTSPRRALELGQMLGQPADLGINTV